MIHTGNKLAKGFQYLNNGEYVKAIETVNTITTYTTNADALMLAGLAYYKLYDFLKAAEFFKAAFNLNKKNQTIQVYLLDSLLKTGEIDIGLEIFNSLTDLNINLIRIGIKLNEENGEYQSAVRLASNMPEGLQLFETLAWNYERLNELDFAEKYSLKVLSLDKTNFIGNTVYATVCLRRKKTKEALTSLLAINKDILSNVNLSIYYSLEARILEKQQKFDKAFASYTKSNETLRQTDAYKNLSGQNYYTFNITKMIRSNIENIKNIRVQISGEKKVVFMIGFPRSGTTLLENILSVHSQIETIEEKPIVSDILEFFYQDGNLQKKLQEISEADITALQNHYLQKRDEYLTHSDSEIIIDKLPLNIIHIGLLYRIFPNAKFIISVRDIRDVALSCYFQNFAINDAMAYFLEWDTTIKYLHEIISLGVQQIRELSIPFQLVEYEKLVETPFKVVKEVIDYLGLEWQDELRDYREKVSGKNINTPSYAAVSEKITTKNRQRWKNYPNQTSQILPFEFKV